MTTEEARDRLDAAMASGAFDAAFGNAMVAAVARFATMHGLAAMYDPKMVALVWARPSRAPMIGASSNTVTAERIIIDESQALRKEFAVSPEHVSTSPEYHTVQYLERFDRSGRRLGFQPKLGQDVIPVCFGTIKGARTAARRKWGRVR